VKTGRLVVCGLGPNPPYTAALDSLHALQRCDVALYADSAQEATLKEFCPKLKITKIASAKIESAALPLLKKKKAVGVVLPNRPFSYSSAPAWTGRVREAGFPCEVVVSVSEISVALSRTQQTLGIDIGALNVFSWRHAASAKALDTKQPLILLFKDPASPSDLALLQKGLRRFYQAAHGAALIPNDYHAPMTRLNVEDLASLKTLPAGSILCLDA
jgi:precorrin-2 methylase